MTSNLPSWLKDVASVCPFLFPFETRQVRNLLLQLQYGYYQIVSHICNNVNLFSTENCFVASILRDVL